jgi:DNA-binding protein HU-beta
VSAAEHFNVVAFATSEMLDLGAWKRSYVRWISSTTATIATKKGRRDNMTKAELIEAVAGQADTTKADAERVIDAFFETVKKEAKKGEKVAWPGFGSFSTSKRPARTGRNPQTGDPVKIAASTAMKFTASSVLKAELNPKKK